MFEPCSFWGSDGVCKFKGGETKSGPSVGMHKGLCSKGTRQFAHPSCVTDGTALDWLRM